MNILNVSTILLGDLKKRNLSRSTLDSFVGFKEIDKKVHFIKDTLIDLKYMEVIEYLVKVRNQKCNEKALLFRMMGNAEFSPAIGNYYMALELYNQSICFSESGSENVSICYGNRSAVLFEFGLYQQCLANIELARKANYPVRFQHTLDGREERCRQLLATKVHYVQARKFEIFEGHKDAMVKYAACLELRSTTDAGRFICTKRDLNVGDMIVVEEPFCTSLLPAMRYVRCATCKQENHLTLIPCERCTSAMFCSENCRTIANATFHQYECPIIDFLFYWFNPIHCIALRVCLSTLDLFPTIEQLMAFCADRKNQNCSAFDLDYGRLTRSEHYRAIHGLVTNQESRNSGDLYQRSVVCAVLEHFLLKHTPLKQFLGGVTGERFFRELIFRHLQTSSCNMQAIDLVEQPLELKDDQTHSAGAYAFLSLLNHSCAPNVLRIYKGTKAFLFVLRPIAANEELFDNYGDHYASHSRNARRERLQMQFHFKCNCEACINDYPIYGRQANPTTYSDIFYIMGYNWRYARDNCSKYSELLNRFSYLYPCDQLSYTEECLKMTLYILSDEVPLKAKITFQKYLKWSKTNRR